MRACPVMQAASVREAIARHVPDDVRRLHKSLREESLAKWRRWARDLARGCGLPSMRELLEAAAVLKIQKATLALDEDAQALREIDEAERSIAMCEGSQAERLAPFAGDRDKLKKALDAAKAETSRLLELLAAVDGQSALEHWEWVVHRTKYANRRRLFPELMTDDDEQEM